MTQRKVDAAEYDRLVRENERLDQFVQKVGKRLSQMKSKEGNFDDIESDYLELTQQRPKQDASNPFGESSVTFTNEHEVIKNYHEQDFADNSDNEITFDLNPKQVCFKCNGSGRVIPNTIPGEVVWIDCPDCKPKNQPEHG